MSKPVHEIYKYIFGLTIPGVKLELNRVFEFSKRIGEPHKAYPIIHIAGTNGKGSTSTMLYFVLQAYGKKTGINISPHLVHPEERIRVNEIPAPSDFIVDKVELWKPHIQELELTFFEVITALAQQYFKEQEVDYAVVETGLGGRLDATNIVHPAVSVITSISLDHTGILGDTLEAVAFEKAGIIKDGKPVVIGFNPPEVMDVLLEKAKKMGAPTFEVAKNVTIKESSIDTQNLVQNAIYEINGQSYQITIPLLGDFQVENFANVLTVLLALDIPIDESTINDGLSRMVWRGRVEVLQRDPLLLYDVAHNPSGLKRLLETLGKMNMDDMTLLAGLNRRKDLSSMFQLMKAWPGKVDFFTYSGKFNCEEHDLEEMLREGSHLYPSMAEAIADKRRKHEKACILGSHYFAEELYSILKK